MKNSKAIYDRAVQEGKILPFLKLKDTGSHRVKLIEDKPITGKDFQGKEVPKIRFTLEENGEKKFYDVEVKDKSGELHYLIQRLAEFEEGTEVVMEYKPRGLRGYIEVSKPGEEIPTIDGNDDVNIGGIPF